MTLFYEDPSNTQKEESKNVSQHWLTTFIIPLGSFLVALLTFLTANAKLPIWATYVVVIFLVVALILISIKPITLLITYFQNKQRRKKIFKTFYPQLVNNLVELGRLIEQGKVGTIPEFLHDISGWEEIRNQPNYNDFSQIRIIRDWYQTFNKNIPKKFPDFSHTANNLSCLIFNYHFLCVQAFQNLEKVTISGKLSDQRLRQMKQEWNHRRESHILFIERWGAFARDLNDISGKRICIDYYEPLKTLE